MAWVAPVLTVALLLVLALARFDLLPARLYAVGGQAMPRAIWLRVAGPPILAAAIASLALAVGLAGRRRWARHCAPALFAGVAVLAAAAWQTGRITEDLVLRAFAECGVLGLASAWYFYAKRNVVEFFRARPSSPEEAR